ncbi:MAG: hypothetical protein WCY11_06190 [Novosphingobium sp.]
MKRDALIGLAALIPAAFNPAPSAAAAGGLVVPLCIGGESGRVVVIPVMPPEPPRRDGEGCCAKGCHTGSSRKRGSCHI